VKPGTRANQTDGRREPGIMAAEQLDAAIQFVLRYIPGNVALAA
jgi:hypothetical protein